jgi:hypothetical protein
MQRAAARRSASACHKVIAPCSTNFDNNPIRIALCPIDACRIRRQNAGSLANLRFGVKHEKQEVSLNIHNLANAKPNLGDIGYVGYAQFEPDMHTPIPQVATLQPLTVILQYKNNF